MSSLSRYIINFASSEWKGWEDLLFGQDTLVHLEFFLNLGSLSSYLPSLLVGSFMGQSEPFSSVTSGGSSSNCFYYFQSSGNGIDFSHAVEKSVRSFGLAAQISELILHKALEYNHSTSAS